MRERRDGTSRAYVFRGHLIGLIGLSLNSPQNFVKSAVRYAKLDAVRLVSLS